MKTNIGLKRIYEKDNKHNGIKILVDRLWPRGIKKEEAGIDEWIKNIAPSDSLRRWFGHDPGKWNEFKKKYYDELREKVDLCRELIKGKRNIILVYSARDEEHNNAVVLKEFLEKEIIKKDD